MLEGVDLAGSLSWTGSGKCGAVPPMYVHDALSRWGFTVCMPVVWRGRRCVSTTTVGGAPRSGGASGQRFRNGHGSENFRAEPTVRARKRIDPPQPPESRVRDRHE